MGKTRLILIFIISFLVACKFAVPDKNIDLEAFVFNAQGIVEMYFYETLELPQNIRQAFDTITKNLTASEKESLTNRHFKDWFSETGSFIELVPIYDRESGKIKYVLGLSAGIDGKLDYKNKDDSVFLDEIFAKIPLYNDKNIFDLKLILKKNYKKSTKDFAIFLISEKELIFSLNPKSIKHLKNGQPFCTKIKIVKTRPELLGRKNNLYFYIRNYKSDVDIKLNDSVYLMTINKGYRFETDTIIVNQCVLDTFKRPLNMQNLKIKQMEIRKELFKQFYKKFF